MGVGTQLAKMDSCYFVMMIQALRRSPNCRSWHHALEFALLLGGANPAAGQGRYRFWPVWETGRRE